MNTLTIIIYALIGLLLVSIYSHQYLKYSEVIRFKEYDLIRNEERIRFLENLIYNDNRFENELVKLNFKDAKIKNGNAVKIRTVTVDYESGKYLFFHGDISYKNITWYSDGRAVDSCSEYDIDIQNDYDLGILGNESV
jgi:hypothetical protein